MFFVSLGSEGSESTLLLAHTATKRNPNKQIIKQTKIMNTQKEAC